MVASPGMRGLPALAGRPLLPNANDPGTVNVQRSPTRMYGKAPSTPYKPKEDDPKNIQIRKSIVNHHEENQIDVEQRQEGAKDC